MGTATVNNSALSPATLSRRSFKMAAVVPLAMHQVGFGTFNNFLEHGEVGRAVSEALKVGYRHFDCAELYSNEAEIGEALQASGIERGELFLVSKVWNHHHAPEDVLKACKRSIEALRCDYLDCYLIHWPVAWDVATVPAMLLPDNKVGVGEVSSVTLEETWAAMESLVQEGLVRHIGVSNFGPSAMERILKVCTIKPFCNQIELHPHFQQNAIVDQCRAHGIRVVAYHPLGKPTHRKEGEPVAIQEPIITDIAAKHGRTPAQVVLQWQLQRGVTVIPKSTTPSRIQENFLIGDFTLGPEEVAAISTLDAGARFCQPAWWSAAVYE